MDDNENVWEPKTILLVLITAVTVIICGLIDMML